jgi:hypothetical protein
MLMVVIFIITIKRDMNTSNSIKKSRIHMEILLSITLTRGHYNFNVF